MNRHLRGEAGYEELRSNGIWNQLKPERYPDMIVRAENADEVAQAVREAAAAGMPVAIKGSGHNYTSTYLREGGMQLDLSGLDTIRMDGELALVGPGARSADVCSALNAEGRMFPTGHHAGVTLGGFLLGGGMGWNGEHWGQFGCFNVLALDVVLASGEQTTISADMHPDLFWAARGAGPLFCAAVTRFYLRTYPLPTAVHALRRVYPLDAAPALSAWLEGEGKNRRKDFELILMFESDPESGTLQCVVLVLYHGSDGEMALRELSAMLEAAPEGGEGPPGPIPLDYEALYAQSLTGDARRTGADTIWTDETARASDIMASHFASVPSPGTVGIVNFRARAGYLPDAACSMIGSGFLQWIGQWTDAATDAENLAWVDDLAVALEPVTKGCYVNETDILRRPDRLRRCFSDNVWKKLEKVRRDYDPEGRFPMPPPDPR